MKPTRLNVRIAFCEQQTIIDEIGNHKTGFQEIYCCFASVESESPTEKTETGLTVEDTKLVFVVRDCKILKTIRSTTHRILFHDDYYNITGIDHRGYTGKLLKIHCERCER